MATLTIYIQQFGTYWNIPPKVFLTICAKMIKTHGSFDWPRKYMLKGRPQSVYKPRDEPESRSFSSRTNVILYHPLDWRVGDYMDAYREVANKLGIMQSPKRKVVGMNEYGFPIYGKDRSRRIPRS